ncbi:hypothetical protein [Cytobacillus oceanisediminis]|uniref:hypothetical protein n=1 Tax=Cytobacillus oceanisediminis TaxID=665099 RepID=UPI003736B974
MKKAWKILLSLVLVIVLGSAGTFYYFFKVKTYEVADPEIEEITDTEYEIILPEDDGDTSAADSAKKENEDINSESVSKSEEDTADNSGNVQSAASSATNSNASTTDNSKKNSQSSSNSSSSDQTSETASEQISEVSVASIKNKFRPSFENLQSQADAKINSIVARAFGEYTEKRNDGESISFAYFFQKYSSAGDELESKTDTAFNMIYGALEEDLKKHGFSPSHAKSFKEEYEQAKKARESALLSKAKEAL